jgi:tetratricopeptide (TPR) repeat protein
MGGAMADKDTRATELFETGLSLFYREQHRDAQKKFLEALELGADNPELNYFLGNTYYYQNRIDKSLEYYRRAVDLDPEDPHYQFVLGNTYLESNQYPQAVEHLEKSVALDDSEAHVFNNLGEALYLMNEIDKSIKAFEQALELDENLADTYIWLYLSLRKADKQDPALEVIKKAEKQIDKEDPLHLVIKFYLGHMDVEDLHKKAEDQINTCKFNYHLGMYFIFEGKLDEARESLAQCQHTGLNYITEYRRALNEIKNI